MKILIDIPDDVNRKLKENSENIGISRSAYVKMLIGIGLQQTVFFKTEKGK